MKRLLTTLVFISFVFGSLYAQVAVNTTGAEPDASAMLDISSTDKGILVPRVTTAQRNAITTPADGLMVYDTEKKSFWFYDGEEAKWVEVASGILGINELSDGRNDGSSLFMGTYAGYVNDGTDNNNTAVGNGSAENNTTGFSNSFFGRHSGGLNTTGNFNSFFGHGAGYYNTTGISNIAIGNDALSFNSTGNYNTAIGSLAGYGDYGYSTNGCVMIGYAAGYYNIENNKLFIENTPSNLPLIGGDFDIDQVDINGKIKITGGFPGSGKVLTSDADGLATWEDNAAATEINDLTDGINDGSSLFLGTDAGTNDDGNNNENTSVGNNSASSITTGMYNAYFGYSAGYNNTTGYRNSFFGANAGLGNISGEYNVAIGAGSLANNSTGSQNTIVGYRAGYGVSGDSFTGCVMLGYGAGKDNTADNKLYIDNSSTSTPLIGGDFDADQVDINGTIKITGGTPGSGKVLTSDNDGLASWQTPVAYATDIDDLSDAAYNGSDLFLGNSAGNSNSDNNSGVAIGKNALNANTTSDFNTAVGYFSLDISTGERNTAVGSHSLGANTSGDRNTSIGYSSGVNNSSGSYNTFIGYRTQANNTSIKVNSTAIGNEAIITASDQVRIGNASVTSIGGQVPWTTLSDGRFKENITEEVAGLDFVLNLRPVSYEVNKTAFNEFVGSEYIDNKKSATQREVGFIAQEVEALIQSLGVEFNGVDAPENEDDYYGIRYSQFVMPLVKAVQELNEKLEQENATLKAQNDEMLKRIEKLEELMLQK